MSSASTFRITDVRSIDLTLLSAIGEDALWNPLLGVTRSNQQSRGHHGLRPRAQSADASRLAGDRARTAREMGGENFLRPEGTAPRGARVITQFRNRWHLLLRARGGSWLTRTTVCG